MQAAGNFKTTPLHCLPTALQEMQVALQGKGMDPNAGSWTIDPVFDGSRFKFGYLVRVWVLLVEGSWVSAAWALSYVAPAAAVLPGPAASRC